MKDKLEPNMYVRTKNGYICKILRETYSKYLSRNKELCYEVDRPINTNMELYVGDILKASHSLLGNDKEPCLIEVGDVIIDKEGRKYAINYEFEIDYNNEYKSYEITIDDYITLFFKDGLSIVTKEQFESMSYKVGE